MEFPIKATPVLLGSLLSSETKQVSILTPSYTEENIGLLFCSETRTNSCWSILRRSAVSYTFVSTLTFTSNDPKLHYFVPKNPLKHEFTTRLSSLCKCLAQRLFNLPIIQRSNMCQFDSLNMSVREVDMVNYVACNVQINMFVCTVVSCV